MPTLTIDYRDESHRIAQALAIAYVTQLRQMVFASDNVWTTSPKRLMVSSEPGPIVSDVVGTLAGTVVIHVVGADGSLETDPSNRRISR